jgi:hypothetical protein
MTTFSDLDLRERGDQVLDTAHVEGEVRIQRSDGEIFVLRTAERRRSGLDVKGIKTNITLEEIVQAVREGRERG